ncbi:unnamed protein product [Aphanomyces euteiches]
MLASALKLVATTTMVLLAQGRADGVSTTVAKPPVDKTTTTSSYPHELKDEGHSAKQDYPGQQDNYYAPKYGHDVGYGNYGSGYGNYGGGYGNYGGNGFNSYGRGVGGGYANYVGGRGIGRYGGGYGY